VKEKTAFETAARASGFEKGRELCVYAGKRHFVKPNSEIVYNILKGIRVYMLKTYCVLRYRQVE
jgi:hypothetical protein